MNRDDVTSLFEQVRSGQISPQDAARRLEDLQTEQLGYAAVDHHRAVRIGFPEVIYGEGKTSEQIVGICRSLRAKQDRVLVTRITEDKANEVLRHFPDFEHNVIARTLFWSRSEIKIEGQGPILVVAAGTSDLAVAEEAAVTARALGNEVDTLYDVGIAGIHRLLENGKRLKSASVLIVVAGMEGALPSVVGGLVDRPVIAVPTSIGYGASFGGIAALLGMLNSCAPGVVVVNIDNGFGAAYAATSMNRSYRIDVAESQKY